MTSDVNTPMINEMYREKEITTKPKTFSTRERYPIWPLLFSMLWSPKALNNPFLIFLDCLFLIVWATEYKKIGTKTIKWSLKYELSRSSLAIVLSGIR